MFKLDLEKAEEPEIKLRTTVGSSVNLVSSRKISTSALLTTPKSLTEWWQQTVENSERDENINHLTCLLGNLYAVQEATVWTRYGRMDWFQIEKGVQGCISSPCLSNFYEESVSSVALSCPTLCDPVDCSTPGLPVHHQLPEFTQTHVQRLGDAIQRSHPLSSPSPPAPNPSQHKGLFQWVNSHSKYRSFSFSISPSNEHPGLISFRMDWLDLLSVQGTLKSLLQHHSSEASIFQCSASFTVQLSHPYMTTGETTALIRQTFVGKVMSLLFNMLSRLVIAFL